MYAYTKIAKSTDSITPPQDVLARLPSRWEGGTGGSLTMIGKATTSQQESNF